MSSVGEGLVNRFAPKEDGNNVEIYTKFLRDKTGVSDNKPVKNFTPDEFDKLWRAIEQMEGYKEGIITEVSPVIEVHRNKTGIYGYHIEQQGWCNKPECLQLTRQDKLDLMIVTSRLGHDYLRARSGSSVNGSLSHMVELRSLASINLSGKLNGFDVNEQFSSLKSYKNFLEENSLLSKSTCELKPT